MIEAKKPLKAKLAGELAAAADESERKEIKVCMKWKAIPQRVPRGLTPTSPFDRPSSRRASVRWSTTLTTRRASSRWYAARPNSTLAATASHTRPSPAQALAVKYNFLSK